MRQTIIGFTAILSIIALAACNAAPEDTTADQNQAMKEVVERAGELINARDFDTLREVIADDYLRHSPATPDINVTNFDEFVEFLRQGAIALPDDHVVWDNLVAEGDLVAFWGRYEGTNTGPGPFPPTGNAVSIEMAGIHRIENGQIAETWVVWDNVAFFAQLGMTLAPAPAQATPQTDEERP